MAMLSSYTFLSRAPAPAPAPAPKSSPAAAPAALQLRHKQPAAAASVAAPHWASCKESRRSRRAPLFVCHAKYKYDIEPSALLHAPKLLEAGGDGWNMHGDKDHIILKFMVGGSMAKDKVKVTTTLDQTHLVIRYTGDTKDDTDASQLNVTLAMPPGYDSDKVTAKLIDDWLFITIVRPKHDPNPIYPSSN